MAGEVEVKSLLLKVDASVELLRKNLSDAGTQLDTFTRKGEQSAQRFDNSMKRVNASTGQMRAGFQQLSFQLGDVATQLSSGTGALQVFAQQSGQVVQAVGLMSNTNKGFIGFLGGPWGAVLTGAITLLVTFGSRMFEAEEATKAAEAGADSLGKAQGVLGQIFDLTSGKIKSQNELLLANARLMASNLRSEALAKRASADAATFSTQTLIGGGTGAGTIAARGVELLTGRSLRVSSSATALLRNVANGSLKPEEALRFADTLDLRGANLSRNELRQAIIDYATASDQERVAGLIDQSLRSGNLATGLRQPATARKARTPRAKKPPADPFASINQDVRDAINAINIGSLDANKASSDASRKFFGSLGLDPTKDFENILDTIEKRKDAEFEANQAIAEDELRKREGNIRSLAALYTDAFQGGTKAIFRDFKQIGLQVIAELLARFTIAKATGSSFDFGAALTSSFQAAGFSGLGFANGGNPPVGKASLVGERGPELFVPRVPGKIIPNYQLGGMGGGVTVTINAPGATAETVSMIRREIANVAPSIVEAATRTTIGRTQRPRL